MKRKKNEDRHRAVVVKQQSEVRKRNDTRVTNYFIFWLAGSENKNLPKSEIKWNFQPTKTILRSNVFFSSFRVAEPKLNWNFSYFLPFSCAFMCICVFANRLRIEKIYKNIIFISDEKNLLCFNLNKKEKEKEELLLPIVYFILKTKEKIQTIFIDFDVFDFHLSITYCLWIMILWAKEVFVI